MKILWASAVALATLSGTAHAHDGKHDRNVVTDYDFADFDTIEVEGVYELRIEKGDSFSVRTEVSEDDEAWRELELDGNTLRLGTKKRSKSWNKGDRNSSSILAYITMPKLKSLDVAGVATGDVDAFDGGNIQIDIAGVSDLRLSGTCEALDIELAGVGDLDASELRCETVDASMGGVGEMEVYASREIVADAGGIGQITVYGEPKVEKTSGGFLSKVKVRR